MALTLHMLATDRPGDLGLQQCGTGAQSVVYLLPKTLRVNGRANLVYKRYRPKAPSFRGREAATKVALEQLIGLHHILDLASDGKRIRTALERHVAWPLAVVSRGNAALGVVEPKIDAAFLGAPCDDLTAAVPLERFIRPDGERALLLGQGLHPLDDDGRHRIALQLVATASLLHRIGLVIGDISLRNVMVYVPEHDQRNQASAAFIDADACRPAIGGCGLPQGSTPAFDPPESRFWRRKADAVPDGPKRRYALAMAGLQTQPSDVYKTALLILRMCSCEEEQSTGVRRIRSATQHNTIVDLFGNAGLTALTDALADTPADRPSMAELYRALHGGDPTQSHHETR